MRLSRLLSPRSIAVIGGGAWCENVLRECRRIGFEGTLWHVHPTRGIPTAADLPAPPDAAFVGVNRAATLDAVQALSDMGAGGAVCFASGFREAQAETGDGSDLQDRLIAAAGEMPILGPNCYGFLNLLDGAALWPDQHGAARCETGVAILTQSSNIALNLTMQRRALPLAYVVTTGNQAQTGMSVIAQTLLADTRVTALGLHIEGVGDTRAFEAMAATARELGKPIVALKTGASHQAQTSAISHTASLAGSDTGASALFDRLNVGRVETLPDLLETLKLQHVHGPLRSNRIASASCSGGEAALIADTALGHDLDFPPLTDAQNRHLRSALGTTVALANPLDYHTYIWADRAAMNRTFTALADADLGLAMVIADYPRPDGCDGMDWDHIAPAVAAAATATSTPMAIVASLPESLPEDTARQIMALGIAPLSGFPEALKAIEIAAWLGRNQTAETPVLLPGNPQDICTLTEAEAKKALAARGLAIPPSETATTVEAAVEAGNRIGFPVALKGQGTAHKTEAGLVALNLGDAAALSKAATEMPADSFLVERMIPPGVELLVGVLADPAHGFVLTIGAGGTLTEILADTVSMLLPVTREQIGAALPRLRLSALLDGHRGAPPVNREALADAILAIQDYVIANADRVAEVEVNPLIVTPEAAIAADALIRTGDAP